MKTLLLTVIVAIGLISASCGATRSQTNSESPRDQTPVTKQTLIVMPPFANTEGYKDLLSVEQKLEELTLVIICPRIHSRRFTQHVKEGKTADAKKS